MSGPGPSAPTNATPAAPSTSAAPPTPSGGSSTPSGGSSNSYSKGTSGPVVGGFNPSKAPGTPSNPANPPPKEVVARQPLLVKHLMPDGNEIELDIAEHVETHMNSTKRKLKVGDQEREFTLKELEERAQLGEGSMTKFREAAEMRKAAEQSTSRIKQIDALMKKSPEDAAKVVESWIGQEAFLEMAAQAIEKRIAYERLSPEERQYQDRLTQQQKELLKLERQKKEYESFNKSQQEIQLKAQAAESQKRFVEHFTGLLTSAGAPVNQDTLGLMAAKTLEYRQLGVPRSAEQIAKEVAGYMKQIAAHYQQSLPPEELQAQLGSNADKLRQADLARVSHQPGRKAQQVATGSAKPQQKQTMTSTEYRRKLKEQDRRR